MKQKSTTPYNKREPSPLYTMEAGAPEYLVCDACGAYWSPDAAQYTWLRSDEYIVCTCGNLLCRKIELRAA